MRKEQEFLAIEPCTLLQGASFGCRQERIVIPTGLAFVDGRRGAGTPPLPLYHSGDTFSQIVWRTTSSGMPIDIFIPLNSVGGCRASYAIAMR